jgi:hypothetical protein
LFTPNDSGFDGLEHKLTVVVHLQGEFFVFDHEIQPYFGFIVNGNIDQDIHRDQFRKRNSSRCFPSHKIIFGLIDWLEVARLEEFRQNLPDVLDWSGYNEDSSVASHKKQQKHDIGFQLTTPVSEGERFGKIDDRAATGPPGLLRTSSPEGLVRVRLRMTLANLLGVGTVIGDERFKSGLGNAGQFLADGTDAVETHKFFPSTDFVVFVGFVADGYEISFDVDDLGAINPALLIS